MDPQNEPSTESVNNESGSEYDILSLPATDPSDFHTDDDEGNSNSMEQIGDVKIRDRVHISADNIAEMFGFDGNKETCEWCEHEQKMPTVKKDKDNADGHFEASSFLLAQQLQNQSLLDNKYVELEKKVNMEKERYEKEIEQLKDKKNELEQTLIGVEKERDALKLELIEKMEIISGGKANVSRSRMPRELELDALCCGIKAVEKLKKNKNGAIDVAVEIRDEFDKKHGQNWHCFVIAQKLAVGRDAGWAVEPSGKNYIDFVVDEMRICLYKTILSTAESAEELK